MNTSTNPQLEQAQHSLDKAMKVIWISIGLSIVSSVVALGFMIYKVGSIFENDPETSSSTLMIAIALAFLGMVLSIVFSIVIAKFIQKGKNVARWVYLVLAVLGLYTGLGKVSFSGDTLFMSIITIGFYLISVGIQAYICHMLFLSPARLIFLKDKMARLESDLQALRGDTSS